MCGSPQFIHIQFKKSKGRALREQKERKEPPLALVLLKGLQKKRGVTDSMTKTQDVRGSGLCALAARYVLVRPMPHVGTGVHHQQQRLHFVEHGKRHHSVDH